MAHLLKKDVVRFNELKKEISGITNTMLSNSLHELENDQLVIRNQYNEMPLRVAYHLTEKGGSLLPLLYELSSWGANQMQSNIYSLANLQVISDISFTPYLLNI